MLCILLDRIIQVNSIKDMIIRTRPIKPHQHGIAVANSVRFEAIRELSNDNGDGNKNVTNLHI